MNLFSDEDLIRMSLVAKNDPRCMDTQWAILFGRAVVDATVRLLANGTRVEPVGKLGQDDLNIKLKDVPFNTYLCTLDQLMTAVAAERVKTVERCAGLFELKDHPYTGQQAQTAILGLVGLDDVTQDDTLLPASQDAKRYAWLVSDKADGREYIGDIAARNAVYAVWDILASDNPCIKEELDAAVDVAMELTEAYRLEQS